jgi:16S rRNA (guanine966-N2)-methyltransferase
MRITGGIARGIQLRVPTKGGVRPATDYIREAIFSSLAAYIPQSTVLDSVCWYRCLCFRVFKPWSSNT